MKDERPRNEPNMRKANSININTKEYWDGIYGTPEKRAAYAASGTDREVNGGQSTERFKRALEEIKDWDRVIDIGCGVGVLTKLIKDKYPNCEVWGMDISKTVIEDNKKERPDIHYRQGTVDNIYFKNSLFDVVFSGEVLEHLDDPQLLISEGYRILKEKGKLIITTPLQDSIVSPEHTWFFTQEDVETFFVKAGFKDIKFVYLPNQEHLMVIFALGTK